MPFHLPATSEQPGPVRSSVCIRVLGDFQLTLEGALIFDLPLKARAIISYLAIAGGPVSREVLAELLWPEREQDQSRQNLRQTLSAIRARCSHFDILKGDVAAASLALCHVTVDAKELLRTSDAETLASLQQRASHYRGEFLSGFARVSAPFDDWVALERSRLNSSAIRIYQRLARAQSDKGCFEEAIETGCRLLELDPIREDSHRLLMELYWNAGLRAQALKQFAACQDLLQAELGINPEIATIELNNKILSTQRSTPANKALHLQPAPLQHHVAHKLENNTSAPLSDISERGRPPIIGDAERRQLTVMSCEIINSSDQIAERDPEQISQVMAQFRTVLQDIVSEYDGAIAQYTAGGALVYFGYPVAQENNAERAISAALAIKARIEKLPHGLFGYLSARFAVASSIVVIGGNSPSGDQSLELPSGEAILVASVLHGVAGPGQIIVSEATRRLTGDLFDTEIFNANFPDAVRQSTPLKAYLVKGSSLIESRFEALRTQDLTPFVGRQEEVALLQRRWEKTKTGRGSVVLLIGDPGIGKSRIAHRLVKDLEDQPHTRLRFYGSPLHSHSAFYPLIKGIENAVEISSRDDEQTKRMKIEKAWQNRPVAAGFIAELLNIQKSDEVKFSPSDSKINISRTLLDQMIFLASQNNLLVIVEDAHWIDPTSLDVLDRLVSEIPKHPILLLITSRQGYRPPWHADSAVTVLSLSRFDHTESETFIANITRGKAIPRPLIEQIVARAEGIPLYAGRRHSSLY